MIHPTAELTAFLDGALPADQRAELEAHLALCPPCRAERDRLASAIGLLSGMPRAEASPTFEQRFYARLATERAERQGRRRFLDRMAWRWLGPGFVTAAAAVAVALYAQRRSDERFLAEHLDLFESYEAVSNVGAVDRPEDVAVVAELDELIPEEGKP